MLYVVKGQMYNMSHEKIISTVLAYPQNSLVMDEVDSSVGG